MKETFYVDTISKAAIINLRHDLLKKENDAIL